MIASNPSWVGRDLEDGRYHVTALLGEGGMALIYRAIDHKRQAEVVLKVPRAHLLADTEFVHRFAREIKTLVELRNPGIVGVLGFGRDDGVPFAVLEYMPGGTLDDIKRPVAPPSLAKWLPDVAAALDHVHASKIVHRDVKPANILFDGAGRARLSDFGVVKAVAEKKQETKALTMRGEAIGTPEYMAPELAQDKPFDGRVDQYALAITVYEMLTGRRPFEGSNGMAVLLKQVNETPPSLGELVPTVPGSLAAAVAKALAKNPNKRFPNCSAFAEAVLTEKSARPTPPRNSIPTGKQPLRTRKQEQSFPWLWAAIGGGLAFIVIMCLVIWLAGRGGAAANKKTDTVVEAPTVPEPAPTAKFQIQIQNNPVVYTGRSGEVHVTLLREGNSKETVTLRITGLPFGLSVAQPSVTIAENEQQQFFSLSANADAQIGVHSFTIEAVANGASLGTADGTVEVRRPGITIASNPVFVQPGATTTARLRITREGIPGLLPLQFSVPSDAGIEVPTEKRVAPGAMEADVNVTAKANAKSADVQIAMNNVIVGSFRIEIGAAPAKPIEADPQNRSYSVSTSAITALAYMPNLTNCLVLGEQNGAMRLWEIGKKPGEPIHTFSGLVKDITVSPEGRTVLGLSTTEYCSCILPSRQNRTTTITNAVRGLRFKDGKHEAITSRTPAAISAKTYVEKNRKSVPISGPRKYATNGQDTFVFQSKPKSLARIAPGDSPVHFDFDQDVVAFNISHDGGHVVAFSASKVWIWKIASRQSPPIPLSTNYPNVSAIAVSPDGTQAALAFRNGEIKILTIDNR